MIHAVDWLDYTCIAVLARSAVITALSLEYDRKWYEEMSQVNDREVCLN